MTTEPALLNAALTAAQRGWHVFPLRPDDKRPAFPGHRQDTCRGQDARCGAAGRHVGWEARATTDPDRIRRCWSTGAYNIGIACGPSMLLVVDLDQPKPDDPGPVELHGATCRDGLDVFAVVSEHAGHPTPVETFIVTTGSGGQHQYYRQPAGARLPNSTKKLGWCVDTRGHGGYVVAAGSTVDGRPYTVEWEAEPVELPAWLGELLRPAPLPVQGPVVVDLADRRRAGYLTAAINGELARVAQAPIGARNRALYLSAVALGQLVAGGALTGGEVSDLLEHAGLSAGLGWDETAKTIMSGLRAGKARPRSVAA